MGYFFRPICPLPTYPKNEEVLVMLAKNMDAPNNKYSLISHEGKEDAMWRSWGCFIHDKHYEKFINKLFVVYHDPRDPTDDYNGSPIYRRRFDYERKTAFNMKYSSGGFHQSDLNAVWKELKELVLSNGDFAMMVNPEDRKGDPIVDKEFIANLKQSLKFIMFSKYDDYHAY